MPLPDTRTDEEIFLAWLRNLRRPGADEIPDWIDEVAEKARESKRLFESWEPPDPDEEDLTPFGYCPLCLRGITQYFGESLKHPASRAICPAGHDCYTSQMLKEPARVERAKP